MRLNPNGATTMKFYLMKSALVAACVCLFSTSAYAFSEQAKTKAALFGLQTNFQERFADSLSLSDYGVCVHSSIKFGLMYVQMSNMDENIQITFQLIHWGLAEYRKRILAENVMTGEQIIETAIKQGKYKYNGNPQQADNMCVEKASIIIQS